MAMTKAECVKKWQPILDAAGYAEIKGTSKAEVVAQLLENTAEASVATKSKQLMESIGLLTEADSAQSNNIAASMKGYDPILIALVRRTMPNLIAYDVCGVQAMNGPTGLVFALRPKYITTPGNPATFGADAFYNEPNTAFSGTGTQTGSDPTQAGYATGTAMPTATAETLGSAGGAVWGEMGITMDKVTVTAQSRALKAEFTTELAHDLMKLHGISAHAELTNLLTGEIVAEINREVVRTIFWNAKPGAQNADLSNYGTAAQGTYDMRVDTNGRWAAERFKGLLFQLEREANQIAIETRRGKGNIVMCSPDVASALSLAGVLDHAPALSTGLDVDPAGNTFVGVLQGHFKVYIDPYFIPSGTSADTYSNFAVVGYKGVSPYDAGFFYCPYVPLESFEARGPDNFQPKIGFKTRYGLVVNPFAKGTTVPTSTGLPEANTNVYYRRLRIVKLAAAAAAV